MKKFIGFLLFFLFIGTVGCIPPIHFQIIGVKLIPIEYYTDYSNYTKEYFENYRPTTEFKEKIVFHVHSEYDNDTDKVAMIIGSQCYAWQPGEIYDNHLLKDEFSLSIDKHFTYSGNIIEAGNNVLHHPSIAGEITIIMDRPYPGGGQNQSCTIEFSDTFVQNALFDSEPHTVTFLCSTSDGRSLQADATVKFLTNS